jgi:hypothetical protein
MDRRHFLQSSIALSVLAGASSSLSDQNWKSGPVKHLIPSANHSRISLKAIFSRQISDPILSINGNQINGRPTDSKNHGFAFDAKNLRANARYELALMEGKTRLTDSWFLSTMPDPESQPEHLRLLVFTCAGGHPLMSEGENSAFLPQGTRRRLLQRGLSFKPHAMIAIGDHVYWDQRTWLESSTAGIRKFSSGLFNAVGMLDREAQVYGGTNEEILKIVAGEQITPLYGTALRSTPSYFISDDHDYFENDEATDRYVTLPPESYQKQFFSFVRDHYLPDFLPSVDVPSTLSGAMINGHNRHFGALRWGRLSETLMYDCAGFLSLKGETAGLIPPEVERWLCSRTADETVDQLMHIPSHPFGWSAGKWREWYPDVADSGQAGTQAAQMYVDGQKRFKLTTGKAKFMWQKGWWNQHQRLLESISNQKRRPGLVLSGDLHATGHSKIIGSGNLSFASNPIHSIITGPLGTGSGWPSTARGTPPVVASHIRLDSPAPVTERNGFTLLDITPDNIRVRLFAWRREHSSLTDIDTLEPYHDVTIKKHGSSI